MPGRTTSTSGAVEDGRTKRPAAAAASAAAAAAAGARPSSVRLRIAGCSNAALNGIYNYVEQHEGWPRWKGERGYHLYRSKQCGRWVINRDFQPEQNLALANIKMAALPVGRCTWRCLLPQQAWGDQIIECSVQDSLRLPCIFDLPLNILRHVLLLRMSTSGNLLRHCSVCARVHPVFRRAVAASPAYMAVHIESNFESDTESDSNDSGDEEAPTEVSDSASDSDSDSDSDDANDAKDAVSAKPNLLQLQWKKQEEAEQQMSKAEKRANLLRHISRSLDVVVDSGSASPLLMLRNGANNTRLDVHGGKALGAALMSFDRPLSGIVLADNQLKVEGIKLIVSAIRGSQIQHLILNGNHFLSTKTQRGCCAFIAALPQSLKVLGLSHTGCRTPEIVALAAVLPRTSITTLYFNNCDHVGIRGWTAFAAMLPQLHGLTTLSLDQCSLRDAGVTALATGFSPRMALADLSLRTCGIEDPGATALAAALHHATKLSRLDILDNARITTDGRAALLAASALIGLVIEIGSSLDD
jgi:hypothetical protein